MASKQLVLRFNTLQIESKLEVNEPVTANRLRRFGKQPGRFERLMTVAFDVLDGNDCAAQRNESREPESGVRQDHVNDWEETGKDLGGQGGTAPRGREV